MSTVVYLADGSQIYGVKANLKDIAYQQKLLEDRYFKLIEKVDSIHAGPARLESTFSSDKLVTNEDQDSRAEINSNLLRIKQDIQKLFDILDVISIDEITQKTSEPVVDTLKCVYY